ncbi:MAG: DoxX family protein [Paludibacter sp.]|nr:DoxX family protein [Paludibacter sp.]
MKNKIICIVIGIVFIVSGTGKIVNTAEFGNMIAQYGFERLRIIAPLIVIAEIALGISLLLCIKPKIMAVCSFVLVTIFTVAFTYGHFKHGINDCGCFGVLKIGQDNVFFIYLRNVILLALSLFVWVSNKSYSEKTQGWKNMFLLGSLLPMIFVAGYTSRFPLTTSKQEPHFYLNKPIKETALSRYLHTSPDSSYLVMCFSYTCPHCLNSIDNFKRYKESKIVDNVVAFALIGTDSTENKKNRDAFIKNFGEDIVTNELSNDFIIRSFIRIVPTFFVIKNDTIRTVIESELRKLN